MSQPAASSSSSSSGLRQRLSQQGADDDEARDKGTEAGEEGEYVEPSVPEKVFAQVLGVDFEESHAAELVDLARQLMYDLPEMNNDGCEYIIDEQHVEHPRRLIDLRVKRKETA